jgi:alanyl-tRNA synthetase
VDHVIGCHIQEDQARFDFRVEERFSSAELADIQCVANEYVLRDYPIQIHTHPDEPEARYWVCNGETIPCGGTHISSTALVGSITVQRKNIGKCKDRLVAKFMQSREVGP